GICAGLSSTRQCTMACAHVLSFPTRRSSDLGVADQAWSARHMVKARESRRSRPEFRRLAMVVIERTIRFRHHSKQEPSPMSFTVYLSGEIHTDWRDEIQRGAEAAGLDVEFTAPVTDHPASDAA